MRALRNTGFTATVTFYVDGVATDADGTVTIAIVDANGTAVASGSATSTGTTGEYGYDISPQSDLTFLTLDWTGSFTAVSQTVTTYIEIVGSFLFTVDQARNYKIAGAQTPLSNTTNYPTEVITSWRDQITDLFEQRTLRSFIKRYCRVEVAGHGGRTLYLADGYALSSAGEQVGGAGRFRDIRRIISVKEDGNTVSTSDVLVTPTGKLVRTNGSWAGSTLTNPYNVVVEFEYGTDGNPEATENGLRLLSASAVPTDVSSRATSLSSEDGTFRLTTYPVPVEEFLRRYDARIYV